MKSIKKLNIGAGMRSDLWRVQVSRSMFDKFREVLRSGFMFNEPLRGPRLTNSNSPSIDAPVRSLESMTEPLRDESWRDEIEKSKGILDLGTILRSSFDRFLGRCFYQYSCSQASRNSWSWTYGLWKRNAIHFVSVAPLEVKCEQSCDGSKLGEDCEIARVNYSERMN